MATVNNPMPTKLQIKQVKGTDPVSGKTLYTSETLSNIRVAATDENLRLTAMEIAALLDLPIDSIVRTDAGTLIEETGVRSLELAFLFNSADSHGVQAILGGCLLSAISKQLHWRRQSPPSKNKGTDLFYPALRSRRAVSPLSPLERCRISSHSPAAMVSNI